MLPTSTEVLILLLYKPMLLETVGNGYLGLIFFLLGNFRLIG